MHNIVLSGTLREFILADVLQLLTQQKVTGKLLLVSGRNEGQIVFKEGTIVSALMGQENFSLKLFYFLTELKRLPKSKVREIFMSNEGNIAELTSYFEKRNIISHAEMETYASTVILDITCSLFLWSSGNYRFDSMVSVDHLIPASIDIPVENVVMEAMRRIDEWHRMREIITEETIFSHAGKEFNLQNDPNPVIDPSLYFFHRIDGTTDVKTLLKDSFLTEYKIYETLYQMLQDELIRPLSDTITQSIRAAMLKKEQEYRKAPLFPPVVSVLVSIGIILLILLLAWLLRGFLLSKQTLSSAIYKNQVVTQTARNHFNDAYLYYRSTMPVPPEHIESFARFSSITGKDHRLISKKRDFDYSDAEKYNEVDGKSD